MKTMRLLAATGLALVSLSAFAQTYTPGTGITGTKHDWSGASGQRFLLWCTTPACTPDATTGVVPTTTYVTGAAYIDPATGRQASTTTGTRIGQCTRCHTPHQAKSTNLLWNHTLTTATYSWDQPETTAGTTYPTFRGDTYKGPTTKCLSCHDGLMASTDGMWFNRQRVQGSRYVAPARPVGFEQDSGHEVAHNSGSAGSMAGSHPVAVPYPFGSVANTYNGSTTGGQIVTSEFNADPTAVGIRLFNDDGAGNITAGAVAAQSGMECTSCHDVHNGASVRDVMLLRGRLAGARADGYICQQCHNK